MAALATYHQQTQFTSDDYKLTISVNGREIEATTVQRNSVNHLINVPADRISDGENKVEMRIEPETKEDWKKTRIKRRYYHAPLEYQGRPISAQSTTQSTPLETSAQAPEKRIS